MADVPWIDPADQIAAVRREIAMRERCYPAWVTRKKMTQAKADHELAAMRAVLEVLEILFNGLRPEPFNASAVPPAAQKNGSGPPEIWLEPSCCADLDGRRWSPEPGEHRAGCDTGEEPVRYVRADLAPAGPHTPEGGEFEGLRR